MPQLSLKQILAYLDDALEARTLREVSEAIAQSKELQELVARIQRVTRRRSLLSEGEREEEALPATLLAQYLEGTLSPEEAGELERRCLQDDAVLAEVATCHQLLYGGAQLDRSRTPPSAYRRMYGLLEGAESKVRTDSSTLCSQRFPRSAGPATGRAGVVVGLTHDGSRALVEAGGTIGRDYATTAGIDRFAVLCRQSQHNSNRFQHARQQKQRVRKLLVRKPWNKVR
jgi:anti-sigma factor RsiW